MSGSPPAVQVRIFERGWPISSPITLVDGQDSVDVADGTGLRFMQLEYREGVVEVDLYTRGITRRARRFLHRLVTGEVTA